MNNPCPDPNNHTEHTYKQMTKVIMSKFGHSFRAIPSLKKKKKKKKESTPGLEFGHKNYTRLYLLLRKSTEKY